MAAALLEPTPKGALALHLLAPWGKGGATWWFETDAGVLLEAKPVAPVETTRTPRVRVVATSGGGGFGKQRLLFAKLSIVRCFSSLGHLNDCECTPSLRAGGAHDTHDESYLCAGELPRGRVACGNR